MLEQIGFALLCDKDGNIKEIVKDTEKILPDDIISRSFAYLATNDDADKAMKMLIEIKNNDAVFNWEMNIRYSEQTFPYHLVGMKWKDDIIIVGALQKKGIFDFFVELMRINNEQTNILRQQFQQSMRSNQPVSDDFVLYSEFSKLNNELIDTHRNLAKANTSLIQKQKDMELINKILRHDLSNAFSVIISAVKLANRTKDWKYLEDISQKAKNGIELINQMRAVAQMGSARVNYSSDKISRHIRNSFADRNINFSGSCQLKVDENIFSVVDNIVSNAFRHGKANTVFVTFSGDETHSAMRISNDGIPIPEEIKPKVFDEHFVYGETGNTGIGLYIVKNIVERYGGRIFLQNSEHGGAEFVIKIPN
jgi:signal transduction histidine kinase